MFDDGASSENDLVGKGRVKVGDLISRNGEHELRLTYDESAKDGGVIVVTTEFELDHEKMLAGSVARSANVQRMREIVESSHTA